MSTSFKNYSKNNKNPKNFQYDSTTKEFDFDYPIFCFKHLVRKHHLDKCDKIQKKAFIERLVKLTDLGFKQIAKSPKHGFGNEKIQISSLKFNPPSFITDDVDFLYAYRFDGKKPFLAYRRPNTAILHVIALDYNYSCYNHG